MGDFNAKVDRSRVENFGLGQRNDRDDYHIRFC